MKGLLKFSKYFVFISSVLLLGMYLDTKIKFEAIYEKPTWADSSVVACIEQSTIAIVARQIVHSAYDVEEIGKLEWHMKTAYYALTVSHFISKEELSEVSTALMEKVIKETVDTQIERKGYISTTDKTIALVALAKAPTTYMNEDERYEKRFSYLSNELDTCNE